ncbi:hypothetical protein EYF80_009396 [Liparis tanakae]|uniref:Uncharacterized protein n=1 Tax=Liparis tanakae TaxID=230148 RepID=A0A4Z2ISV0_9TELE|nr:hypothetical protein EYF80_009396 [Liparis tanakae]
MPVTAHGLNLQQVSVLKAVLWLLKSHSAVIDYKAMFQSLKTADEPILSAPSVTKSLLSRLGVMGRVPDVFWVRVVMERRGGDRPDEARRGCASGGDERRFHHFGLDGAG